MFIILSFLDHEIKETTSNVKERIFIGLIPSPYTEFTKVLTPKIIFVFSRFYADHFESKVFY